VGKDEIPALQVSDDDDDDGGDSSGSDAAGSGETKAKIPPPDPAMCQ
jgi:hypothetical protein